MQTLANYLLELEDATAEERTRVALAALCAIEEWLKEKGAPDPKAESGTFVSRTPRAQGSFTRCSTSIDSSHLTRFHLEEPSPNGQIFGTTVSVAISDWRLVVYVHQTLRNTGGLISPIFTDPKCPWVIRQLFQITDRWSMGGRELPIPVARPLNGETGGAALGEIILSPDRRLPIIVVSENGGQLIWPSIAAEIAKDLTALALVVEGVRFLVGN